MKISTLHKVPLGLDPHHETRREIHWSCVSGGLHPSLATSIQRVVVRIREAHGRQRSWRGWKVDPAGQCSGSFEVHVITCFKEHLLPQLCHSVVHLICLELNPAVTCMEPSRVESLVVTHTAV